MSLVVVKFGGTSLGTPACILRAAKKIQHLHRKHDVVVVVSAMAHTTDKLFNMSKVITLTPSARELDMLLTAGERISVALMSLALGKLKVEAVSLTGSQVGIITDTKHTDARIVDIRGDRIKRLLMDHKIPVICGFQGVSLDKEITTLGRGGSDTTALALGAVLNAEKCIIYTDVDGVFTEDPNRFPGVKKIGTISYDEMLELATRGAQVLHPRASSIAARFTLPVEIRNSFNNKSGTLITGPEDLERPRPKAITHCEDLYLITLVSVPKRPHYLSQMVTELAHKGIHLKFFFHGISEAKKFDLSFIVPLEEMPEAKSLLTAIAKKLGVERIREIVDICSISIVGRGIGSEHKVLTDTFDSLAHARAHVEAITTSELSITMFLKKRFVTKAIRALLTRFNLRKK